MRSNRVRARRSTRLYATLGAAGLIAAVAAPTASATTILGGKVRAAKAAKRSCDSKLMTGKRGVAVRRVTAADTGLVRVRLGARRGDWDVAVFDARTKRLITASTNFRSRELAEGVVVDGQRLAVQACRRKGRARRATIDVRTIALPAPTGEKVQLVRVKAASQAERSRLAASDFDLTEHGGKDYLDVLVHGDADLERLHREKFKYEILIADVVAADQATLRGSKRASKRWSPGDGTPAEGARAPVMPSGRLTYRHLWDYTDDMKALVEHPDLKDYVRPITLEHPSLEGRPVQGIEIAKDVRADDGRPVFLQMGLHHAREWPSGEHALEFGYDLVNNRNATAVQFASGTVNVKKLLEDVRTIVVPVVNPDGFNWSREAAVDGQQGVIPASMAYKRKNCRIKDGFLPQPGECAAAAPNRGVDPNRNYGGLWGGPGASNSPTNETYWGAGPFSEPETQNVRELVSQRQVVGLITNHTYSDLVLRPPGLKAKGEPYDEKEYAALGKAMADENGYTNQPSYDLYDTTGTTEDWTYYATGGFGFTFEIGKGEGVALTGAGFHPVWPAGVLAEYYGKGPWAARGNRSAYFKALEWAAQAGNHSVIEGTAKPGWQLRLSKSFETLTSPRPDPNDPTAPPQPIAFTDTLETTLQAGDDGRFTWHVNPSTRPDVAKGEPGRVVDGRPQTEPMTWATSGIPFAPGAKTNLVSGVPSPDVPGTYEEVKFEIPESEDNGEARLRIEYPPGPTEVSDIDLYVHRVLPDGSLEQIGSSTSDNSDLDKDCTLDGRNGKCAYEEAVIPDIGNGKFLFRVHNWLSDSTDWRGRITFKAPIADPGVPPATESWTLSCINPEENEVVAQRQVVVARGEAVDVGNACKKPKKDKGK